jgi:dihydrofolate reductase
MKKPIISIIAAIGANRELGKDNKLLWHIPEDLKRFKKLTEGHAVIMGRKTFESLGKPLLKRINIVVTRDIKKLKLKTQNSKLQFKDQNLIFCDSLEKAIKTAKSLLNTKYTSITQVCNLSYSVYTHLIHFFSSDELQTGVRWVYLILNTDEIFIIGGGEIYRQALPLADKLYLTIVDAECHEADTFFPDYSDFKKIISEENHQDGNYSYRFVELTK